MGHCMGKYYCLGGLMGPPWSQMVDLGPLGRDGVGVGSMGLGCGVWVFRLRLLVNSKSGENPIIHQS